MITDVSPRICWGWLTLQVVSPSKFFELLYDFADLLFVVLVGDECSLGRVNDNAIFHAERHDQVLPAAANDRAAGSEADVPANDCVAVRVAAGEPGERLPA